MDILAFAPFITTKLCALSTCFTKNGAVFRMSRSTKNISYGWEKCNAKMISWQFRRNKDLAELPMNTDESEHANNR